MDYVAYADESGTGEQFTSIASFSCRSDALSSVNDRLLGMLSESDVGEFKWQKLKDAKYRHCAIKLVDAVWDLLDKADARVDVLVWDNHDSRHSIPGRDNTANFGRMFFHVHSQALKRRPRNSTWRIFPGERVEIAWDTVLDCLAAVGRRLEYVDSPLFGGFFTEPYYAIKEFRQVQSHEEPCCQLADLFSGLAVFSRTNYDSYSKWLAYSSTNLALWDELPIRLSNREENRFLLLQYFDSGCKSRSLGVSLKTSRYLNTPRPSNPINFWHYAPQHEFDRAPTRSVQQSLGGDA